jgi:hypothetical protein
MARCEMSDERPFDGVERVREGERPDDAGGYIGREPELAADTIPGGVQAKDERIGGTATQSSGVGAQDHRLERPDEPHGHREAATTDDDVRRAGEDH